MQPAVHYAPDVEVIQPHEQDVIRELVETLQEILDTTSETYGHAVRSVHAKSHGIITAELEILPGLPDELAQGMFAQAGRHPALLRISTNPGDLLHDSISVPRGIALKVLEVEGPRLAGAEGRSQDFIMVNGPAFNAKDAGQFLKNLKLLAKTTDRAEWAKRALSSVLRGAERVLEAVGLESSTLIGLGGAPNVHPLGETYFSQTPYRYGDYMAKFSLLPVSQSLKRHTGEIIDTSDRPDALREEVDVAMQAAPAEWHFRVQLCRDLKQMPIEDPTVLWDEKLSPFITVARLIAKPQRGWSPERAADVDDTMRFSIWTGLAAHQPLGNINRARQAPYKASAEFRAKFNRCPVHEPDRLDLP